MTNRTEKVANHNKNSGSFFKLEKQNNLLNYQFKFMDYEAVIQWVVYLKLLKKPSRSPAKRQTEDWSTI